jgi:hypothetical protein
VTTISAATSVDSGHAPGGPQPRAPQADGGLDPPGETRWRGLARQLIADQIAQGLYAIALGRQRGIVGDRALELERVRRVELAVEIGVDEQVVAGGCCCHGSSTPKVAIRRRRARASRDITVPIGALVTWAMSR